VSFGKLFLTLRGSLVSLSSRPRQPKENNSFRAFIPGCYIGLFLFCLIKVCHLKQLQDNYQPLILGRHRRVKPCPISRCCPKIFLQALPITGYTQSPEPSSEDVEANTAISTWLCY